MTEIPDAETIKAFNDAIADEFRANAGKVGGQFDGAKLLLLTTTGAKSGQSRLSPLAYFDIDGKRIILGSFAGSPKDPAWVHNLRANPRVHLEVATASGVDTYDATARELPSGERDAILPKVVAAAPVFAEYQSKSNRIIPLFELRRG
ncbi:nitroreductase family deazaflavin-dependent oxidoreductase [Mycobacterium sp. pR1184]|uniref:nitroreductase family deazaflavin-dependent oxidoreductase n=1 Tax=Mycobacterium sp. pR1184 TaxID=3238981 RepID=UPI00351AB762